MTSHSLNSQRFCVNSLQCLRNFVCDISHPASPKDVGLYYFLFRRGSLDRRWRVWEGGSTGVSDVADSSGCFRQRAVCRSLLVMPLSFVFRGNNCTPRSFREESHITDATDPLMPRTFFSTFLQGNLNGRQVGIMANNWV